MQYIVDATGKSLGRIASEVAVLLMGKQSPAYRPNVVAGDTVMVTNLSKARFTGTKLHTKKYYRFTGYPTGVHAKTMEQVWQKDPAALLTRVVSGMLPKNKLRPLRLKHLKVTL